MATDPRVGTDTGTVNVYDRVDLVLPQARTPLLLHQIMMQKNAAKAASKKQTRDALKDLSPEEYWLPHDVELKDEFSSLQDMGAQIMAAGADPFTGTDPASVTFRKKAARLENASKFSMQLKDYHKLMQEKLTLETKQGGERYTPESKAAVNDYLNMGLFDAMKSGKVPPSLEVKNPAIDLLAYDSKFAQGAIKANKEGIDDASIREFAEQSLANDQISEAISSQMSQLKRNDPGAYDLIEKAAQNDGMSTAGYLRYNQMKWHFSDPTDAFDFKAVEDGMVPGKVKDVNETGDVTTTWEGVPDKKIKSLVTAVVTANPKYVQAGVKSGRFGSPTNGFDDNVKAAIKWNVGVIKDRSATINMRTLDEPDGGYGNYTKEEVDANRSLYIEHFRSDEKAKVQEAAAYLVDNDVILADGREISNINVIDVEQKVQEAGGERAVSTLAKTNHPLYRALDKAEGKYIMQVSTTKPMTVGTGDEKEYVESRDFFYWDPQSPEAKFGIGSNFDEEILNLHDASFKKSKRPYGTTFDEFKTPASGTGFKIPGQ